MEIKCAKHDVSSMSLQRYEAELKDRAEARLKRGRRIRKKRKRSNDEASAADNLATKVQKFNQASGVDAGKTPTPMTSQNR